jgi:hypothetical protein
MQQAGRSVEMNLHAWRSKAARGSSVMGTSLHDPWCSEQGVGSGRQAGGRRGDMEAEEEVREERGKIRELLTAYA